MRRALVLALGSLVALAHARAQEDARAATRMEAAAKRAERVLAESERELRRGHVERAMKRLARGLSREPSPRLALRYAELALPFSGALGADVDARVRLAEPLHALLPRVDLSAIEREGARQLLLHGAYAALLVGDDEGGIVLLLQAGRLQDPATVAALRALAAVATRREQLELAEQLLAMARQYLPQDLELARELALVSLARGEGRAAVTLLEERFAVEPHASSARRDLAYALVAVGRADDALVLFSDVRDACMRNAGCALEAARSALEAGEPAQALDYARAVLAERSELDAMFVIAEAHVQRGELEEAKHAYADVLRVQPDSVRAKLALEQLTSPQVAP